MPNTNEPMDADDLAELRSIIEELARHAKAQHVVPVRSPIFDDLLRLFAEFDRQAQQRDRARREVVSLVGATWHGEGEPTQREHAERLYPGEGERLFLEG